MKGRAHRIITRIAHSLAQPPAIPAPATIKWSEKADRLEDMELVHVRGFLGPHSRDDPHNRSLLAINDRFSHKTSDILPLPIPDLHWTAMNHYIDVRKPGIYDDHDGYAYHRGSAHLDQHERVANVPVDEAIAAVLSTSYVHAPSHPWYRDCSPAIARYSRTLDGTRFPLAGSRPAPGTGVPHSVFLPVDSMAAYWASAEGEAGMRAGLVLHAVQDASVPHHAAGTAGNWHVRWEEDQLEQAELWREDYTYAEEVKALRDGWVEDPAPEGFAVGDLTLAPGPGWPVDALVTWVALHAWEAYRGFYGGFPEYKRGRTKMRELGVLAGAASVLALERVQTGL